MSLKNNIDEKPELVGDNYVWKDGYTLSKEYLNKHTFPLLMKEEKKAEFMNPKTAFIVKKPKEEYEFNLAFILSDEGVDMINSIRNNELDRKEFRSYISKLSRSILVSSEKRII